ncbi:MAG: PQQ-binding-like beta-propeller repeat protein, partial [Rhodospirillales bacterium]|nr:PQQ-binding-like beta-propeller repeat protein [Rhodospirillales bacterium]
MRPANRFAIFLLGTLSLSGCDTFFGLEETPPLPGKRISILVHEQTLEPDSAAANQKIILPAPTVNSNWPQAGGYPNHAMHHIKTSGNIQEAWSVNIGAGSDNQERLIAQPVVAEGRVYTMDANSEISAFDAKTGDDIWTTEITPDDEDDGHIGGGLAFEDGKLFVTTGFAEVISLDASNGKILWRRK